ncbi:hypothetical protein [Verrucosispora sp. WMMC514]|uniref:hypothetical protein n=1 Tax=Verrucosispora sp. WMMC514 TaxID=3015156 RepID=UPI00248CD854|nr:hypothetical protein [Verrucosispora sp. WMMC514]WBB91447.1 hypothetical protein O7597_31575 [Verrucosispora sp. WMMC514]WBB91478.1 hypothetical protein O7597_00030 [Verrucosispora sp. WMMC514]
MSGFYVDVNGMDGVYNVLHRASQDAAEGLHYMTRHCDLTFDQEGLIFMLAGPHQTAYRRMSEGLERLKKLLQSAATQVNLAQGEYVTSDADVAADLDRTYPGASDPSRLRGTLAGPTRPDLWPAAVRSPFADVVEPTARLVPPSYITGVEMFQINPMSDLLSPAAWVRQVSVWLFGKDPFESWGKAFSGDWNSYVHCAAAWRIIGNSMDDIGRNLITGAADVSTVWRGNAAEAEQEYQLSVGLAARALHPVCDQYADLYSKAAEAAKQLYSVVTGLISKLIDVLIVINAAAAVGTATIKTGVGAVIGYSVAGYYAWQAYDLYDEISSFFGNAEMVFKGIAASIEMVKAGMEVASLPDLEPYQHPALVDR